MLAVLNVSPIHFKDFHARLHNSTYRFFRNANAMQKNNFYHLYARYNAWYFALTCSAVSALEYKFAVAILPLNAQSISPA